MAIANMLILPSKKIKDIRGETFGRLVVREFSHIGNHWAIWLCDCLCGNTTLASSHHLRSGGTQSCGCLHKELSRIRIKKLHNTGKHLYFIRCGEYVKIGRADNVSQRLGQIRAANPHPVELLMIMENEGDKEKEFHEKFKPWHHTGEWFKFTLKFTDGCEVVDLV